MTLGARIRSLRKELGYSQAELARKLKMSPAQLYRYENGRGNPSVVILYQIASALDASVDFLISGHDKSMAKKAALDDEELLDLLRRIAQLKGAKRDKIKWAIRALLDGEIISSPKDQEPAKIAKSA